MQKTLVKMKPHRILRTDTSTSYCEMSVTVISNKSPRILCQGTLSLVCLASHVQQFVETFCKYSCTIAICCISKYGNRGAKIIQNYTVKLFIVCLLEQYCKRQKSENSVAIDITQRIELYYLVRALNVA